MSAHLLGCGHLDSDETDAAARPRAVIGDGIVSHKAFVIRRAGGHCRHDNAIWDFNRSDTRWGEEDVHLFIWYAGDSNGVRLHRLPASRGDGSKTVTARRSRHRRDRWSLRAASSRAQTR